MTQEVEFPQDKTVAFSNTWGEFSKNFANFAFGKKNVDEFVKTAKLGGCANILGAFAKLIALRQNDFFIVDRGRYGNKLDTGAMLMFADAIRLSTKMIVSRVFGDVKSEIFLERIDYAKFYLDILEAFKGLIEKDSK